MKVSGSNIEGTASYAVTASFAENAGGGGGTLYTFANLDDFSSGSFTDGDYIRIADLDQYLLYLSGSFRNINNLDIYYTASRAPYSQIWLDASDESTVILDANNFVTQVINKGNPDITFTQTTQANRPFYLYSIRNGLNVFKFDGSNDRLEIGNLMGVASPASFSVYVVYQSSQSANSAYFYDIQTTRNIFAHLCNQPGGFQGYYDGTWHFSGSLPHFGWQLAEAYHSSSIEIIWNGNKSILNVTSSTAVGWASGSAATIGSRYDGLAGTFINGMIGEIRIYTRSLTAEERIDERNELNNKWNLF